VKLRDVLIKYAAGSVSPDNDWACLLTLGARVAANPPPTHLPPRTHVNDLKEVTDIVLYERFREQDLAKR